MKKLLITIALAALLSAPASAVGFGVGAGYVLGLPMGDFADGSELSVIGFGGKLMVGVMPNLDVEIGVNYHVKFPVKDATDDDYSTVMPIKIGVAYKLPVGPVVIAPGGGGAYTMFTPHDVNGSGDTESDFGFYVNAAIKYPITPEMYFSAAPGLLYVMSEDDADANSFNTMIIEFPIGIEYWFM
jgi:hypothetical protein